MSGRKGFSIIELVIAISLASFVLVGVATIAAQMARNQVDGIRSGTATGWSVISYVAMAKEIEDSNVLAFPIANGASSDSLILYKNWSRQINGGSPGGMLDGKVGATVSIIQYCVDPTPPVAPQTGYKLRRYERTAAVTVLDTPPFTPADPAAPVACTDTPGGTWTDTSVVGFRLEKITGFPNVFTRDNSIGGVRVRYVIGRQTPTANDPNPKSTPFDIGISMQKQYSSTVD